jgi:hypothetical protein
MEEVMRQFAVANISMLAQIATGEHTPKEGEIEERAAWLVNFALTGQGIVSPEAIETLKEVGEVLKGRQFNAA